LFSSKILHIMSNNDNLLNRTDIFSHLTSLRYVPRWIVLFIDIALCAIAFFIADFIIGKIYTGQPDLRIFNFYQDLSIILFTQIVFFWIFHTYSGVLRYSGYVDAAKLLFAVSANVIVLSFINFSFFTLKSVILFYYYGLILYAGFSFLFLFFLRLAAKTFFDYFTQSGGKITPVMIYGTKTAAVGIAKMLSSEQADTKFKLVGFIDDDKKSTQRMIMGVKVYHFDEKIIKKKK